MAMTEAEQVLIEIQQYLDEKYKGRNIGFIMTVFCTYGTGSLSASAKTCSDAIAKDFFEKMVMLYNKENANELPRPERMHSDRCRTAIRSSKDSNNAN